MILKGIKNLVSFVKEFCKEQPTPVISVQKEGFSVKWGDRPAVLVFWTEVRQIFAFKEDVFAYDIICLGFRITDDGEWVMVHEEMKGYKDLVSEIERRFSDYERDWWEKVAYPAFERCFTPIWGEKFDWE